MAGSPDVYLLGLTKLQREAHIVSE